MATEQPLLPHFIAAEIHAMVAAAELAIEIDLDMDAVAEADAGTHVERKVEIGERYRQGKAVERTAKEEGQDSDAEKGAEVKISEERDTGADETMSRSNSATEPRPAPVPDTGSEDSSYIKVKDEDTDAWETDSELSSLRSSSPEPPNPELRRISYAIPRQVECRCLGWCFCPMHAAHPDSIRGREPSGTVAEQRRQELDPENDERDVAFDQDRDLEHWPPRDVCARLNSLRRARGGPPGTRYEDASFAAVKTGESSGQRRYRYPHLSDWALSAISHPPSTLRTTLDKDVGQPALDTGSESTPSLAHSSLYAAQ